LTEDCFQDATINICSNEETGTHNVASTTYHDVTVGWNAPWKAKISVGARNVFSREPPIVANAFAGSFDAAYDLPNGAFWFVQYRQDF
jgi:iron complex outermembrane receptor protein